MYNGGCRDVILFVKGHRRTVESSTVTYKAPVDLHREIADRDRYIHEVREHIEFQAHLQPREEKTHQVNMHKITCLEDRDELAMHRMKEDSFLPSLYRTLSRSLCDLSFPVRIRIAQRKAR